MTEKRFVLEDEVIIDNNSIADDGGRQLYWTVEYVQRQKLVDLMNTLAEENKQLKSYTGEMEDYLARLEEKNEQLKADKQALIDFIRKEFPKSHKHILEGLE